MKKIHLIIIAIIVVIILSLFIFNPSKEQHIQEIQPRISLIAKVATKKEEKRIAKMDEKSKELYEKFNKPNLWEETFISTLDYKNYYLFSKMDSKILDKTVTFGFLGQVIFKDNSKNK